MFTWGDVAPDAFRVLPFCLSRQIVLPPSTGDHAHENAEPPPNPTRRPPGKPPSNPGRLMAAGFSMGVPVTGERRYRPAETTQRVGRSPTERRQRGSQSEVKSLSNHRGSFRLGVGGAEGLVEGLDAGEISVDVELVGEAEGGADFDILWGKVMAVDEHFTDLVGIVGILAVFGVVALCEETGVAALDGGAKRAGAQGSPSSSSSCPTTSAMKSWKPQPMPSVVCSTFASRSWNCGYSPRASLRNRAASSSSADSTLL